MSKHVNCLERMAGTLSTQILAVIIIYLAQWSWLFIIQHFILN